MPEPSDVSPRTVLGFWAGYGLWLQVHWRVVWVLVVLSVLLFLLGLWLGSADQDPFQYEIF